MRSPRTTSPAIFRPHGIHKGRAVAQVLAHSEPGALVLAIGDDRTDEDLFAALPDGSVAVHVGPAPSRAPIRIRDVSAARALLARIADARPAGAARGGDAAQGGVTAPRPERAIDVPVLDRL
jgi:trehalose-6-phosphatase